MMNNRREAVHIAKALNSSSLRRKSVYSILYGRTRQEQHIRLGDVNYTLFWTPHARKRAENREKSCTIVLGTYLIDTLKVISEKKNKLLETRKDGYICVRDFSRNLFAVIHIEHENNKIRVITCGKLTEIYPKKHEFVINRHLDDNVTTCIWSEK